MPGSRGRTGTALYSSMLGFVIGAELVIGFMALEEAGVRWAVTLSWILAFTFPLLLAVVACAVGVALTLVLLSIRALITGPAPVRKRIAMWYGILPAGYVAGWLIIGLPPFVGYAVIAIQVVALNVLPIVWLRRSSRRVPADASIARAAGTRLG